MPGPGRFITFEGGEGAGKSTQIERLSRRLRAEGLETVTTREPGGPPRAERIREALLCGRVQPFGPMAETLLFAAARAAHLEATIRPALARGAFVLCDRFADSTRVYQGALARVDAGFLASLERVVLEDTRPDLTLVLDVPAETGLARASERRRQRGEKADRFEGQDLAYHTGLRAAFRKLVEAEPGRCVLIDAAPPADRVEEAIWECVRARLLRDRPVRSAWDEVHAPGP